MNIDFNRPYFTISLKDPSVQKSRTILTKLAEKPGYIYFDKQAGESEIIMRQGNGGIKDVILRIIDQIKHLFNINNSIDTNKLVWAKLVEGLLRDQSNKRPGLNEKDIRIIELSAKRLGIKPTNKGGLVNIYFNKVRDELKKIEPTTHRSNFYKELMNATINQGFKKIFPELKEDFLAPFDEKNEEQKRIS